MKPTKFLRPITTCLAAVAFFATATVSRANNDQFLKLTDIEGESQDDNTELNKTIEVLAWSWGASQSGSLHFGGGGGAGKANFQDISITKYLDKSSPKLLLHVANGDHIEEAKLTIRNQAGVIFLVITMTDVIVTSVSTGGSGGEDRLTENINLNFAEINLKYTPLDENGAAEDVVEFKWDIAGNKPG